MGITKFMWVIGNLFRFAGNRCLLNDYLFYFDYIVSDYIGLELE